MEQYINKEDLVKEIKKLIKKNDAYDKPSYIADVCYKQILSYINALEVKEADLDFTKEVDLWVRVNGDTNGFFNVQELAKYFFELGIKTIKGE